MSLVWNRQEIAGLVFNRSTVSACYNSEIVWPVGGGDRAALNRNGNAEVRTNEGKEFL